MGSETAKTTHAELWREPVRRRLVRLCAAITGDPDAAEDLAQETLLEALRNVHKLHDPAGAEQWLNAIARNVCRRWARSRGRESALIAPVEIDTDTSADALDLDAELDRGELVELLDRALGLLPADTRDVLVQRYVHELPHAEIGRRLGLSEDAVTMRASRGKAVLRRLLGSELRDEAAAHGLLHAADQEWVETRVWCADCGRRRLVARREASPGSLGFRCPGCDPDLTVPSAEFALGNPFFAQLVGGLVRPAAMLNRVAEWTRRYYADGAQTDVPCTRCGGPVTIKRFWRDAGDAPRDGLYVDCPACGEQSSTSVEGIALATPEVRRFRRAHPRTSGLPRRAVDWHGAPAILVRRKNLLGSDSVDVVLDRDTLRVLHAPAA
jgi:RNA polymerase sigma factor (sigma-70 family)